MKRGQEVKVMRDLPKMFSSELGDAAPYRWIANRKGGETGRVAGPFYIDGTEYVLVVHVGELEAIYRPSELEEVQ